MASCLMYEAPKSIDWSGSGYWFSGPKYSPSILTKTEKTEEKKAMKLGEAVEPKLQAQVRPGMFVRGGFYRSLYLLAQTGPGVCQAICLETNDANRRSEGCKCQGGCYPLSESDLKTILGDGWRDYTVEEPIALMARGHAGKKLGSFFAEPAKVKIGTYLRGTDGCKYLISSAGSKLAIAIDVQTGARYRESAQYESIYQLSADELSNICGSNWRNWEILPQDQVLAV